MHMADALVAPAVAATMYVASSVAGGYSIRKIRLEDDSKKIPVMGVMGAFVFAAQMINFTIPGTGSSGHLCGGILLSAILGPYAAFLTMIACLLIQCLMFADGGLLALGCNIWNMAFYACFFGYFCIYKPILKKGYSRKKIILASMLGSILSLQLGSFSVALETLASGVTELPFLTFVSAMQPIHLVIGSVEGLITSAVLIFVYEARPELLDKSVITNRMSFKQVIVILSVITLLIAGGLSLLASSDPDGLEWSMGKVAGTEELEAKGQIYDSFENAQGITAVLPDYSFKEAGGALGTSFSGIAGAGIVAGFCVGGAYCYKVLSKKKSKVTISNLKTSK